MSCCTVSPKGSLARVLAVCGRDIGILLDELLTVVCGTFVKVDGELLWSVKFAKTLRVGLVATLSQCDLDRTG